DSDVKRRMLELQADWDEAEFGFSKFSRFLRHAHDAEVVNVERLDNGNYQVRLIDGAPEREPAGRGRRRGARTAEPARSREAAAEAPKPAAEPAARAVAEADAQPEKPARAAADAKTKKPAEPRARVRAEAE